MGSLNAGTPWWAGLVVLLWCLTTSFTFAADVELGDAEKDCLACHDKEGVKKVLQNGEVLSMRISTKAYLESMHNETACEDCHADLDAKTHGKVKSDIKSKRDFTLAQGNACRDCHKKKYVQYDDSVHAAMVKEGNEKAPLCSDCHNPHTVRSFKEVQPIEATPCVKCHEAIFKAYSKDVHGLERIAKGKSAPLCADCHQAHDVKAASMGDGVKDTCLSCHKEAVAQHQDWLPNTGLHFASISCPACHVPTAQRRVNLRLFDAGKNVQLSEKTGVPKFESLTDAADGAGMGLDERALWSLLKEFNQEGAPGKTVLRGRLEVKSGVEAHQLSEKEKAIKDCNACHQAGAAPFQSVTLTIAGPDGRPLRHGVQKEVLSSLTSMNSVRGFYAIGSTRIKLLDILLVMVLAGAVCVPIGHMTIKRLFKGVRERLEAERLAAAAAGDAATPGAPSPSEQAPK
ncbi:MAG: hypothetical protein K9J77_06120 [Rhodoferax sp.]|nr:hypothetical protein [Rhodoferax sp.]